VDFLVRRSWSAVINAERCAILMNVDLVKRLSFKLVDVEKMKERLNVGRPQAKTKKKEYLCVIEFARN
jgi:hypothetical protein